MGDKTGIQWTDATWNPTNGCSRVSPGCENCYAERFAGRFSAPGQRYEGLVRLGKNGARWTGKMALSERMLDQPLRWKRPRRIFVNSMSDLFHEGIDPMDIEKVFARMALAPQHTFQILTKRADRMRWWFSNEDPGLGMESREAAVQRAAEHAGDMVWDSRGSDPNLYRHSARMTDADLERRRPWPGWPLPNMWLGVSVEDQQRADERIPQLLRTPASVRFVSYEPALGPVELQQGDIGGLGRGWLDPFHDTDPMLRPTPRLDWVIVGGESGPGARPFCLSWARNVVYDCAEAGVACFVKQLGAKPYETTNDEEAHKTWPLGRAIELHDRKGGDWEEWPDYLRVREFPVVRP